MDSSESFAELRELATGAGAVVAGELFQSRQDPDSATLIGPGKVIELKELAEAAAADVVIFDYNLSPTQQRNLEKAVGCKVIDRTQLILDIFAKRARTAEGRLQVELAQLKYILPRLSGHGASMSRLGGGIGTRGPGETKLETDRRRISIRIKKLERELEGVRAGRALHRENRDSIPVPTVSLAGYTNAGKSTLFNRLTNAAVLADARMFATLDPTVRGIELPSKRQILLSDTVGFVRNLPTTLIEAFRATLEEVAEAQLILHVVDCSSEQADVHIREVFRVLGEIGAKETPQLLVLNKADLLPPVERDVQILGPRLLAAAEQNPAAPVVLVSGRTGAGIETLFEQIDKMLAFDPVETACFRVPAGDGAAIALLHRRGRVVTEFYDGETCELVVEAPESLRRTLRAYQSTESTKAVENSVQN